MKTILAILLAFCITIQAQESKPTPKPSPTPYVAPSIHIDIETVDTATLAESVAKMQKATFTAIDGTKMVYKSHTTSSSAANPSKTTVTARYAK